MVWLLQSIRHTYDMTCEICSHVVYDILRHVTDRVHKHICRQGLTYRYVYIYVCHIYINSICICV